MTVSLQSLDSTARVASDISAREAPELDLALPPAFVSLTEQSDPVVSLSRNVLIQGHAKEALRLIPEASVQTVVTSPPYWSLRDYDVDRQLGCGEPLSDYIGEIVDVFEG